MNININYTFKISQIKTQNLNSEELKAFYKTHRVVR